MSVQYPEPYLQGVRCFNEGRFFECHELLESLWLETGGIQGTFYQALIQAAVALHHLEGKNLFGAHSLSRTALQKLAQIPDFYMGLAVRKFENNLREFFRPFLGLEKGHEFTIDHARMPKLELTYIG